MRSYEVTITGVTPLLMHYDNIEWADKMTEWRLQTGNKKKSVAGDDRSPAFRWIGSLYMGDSGVLVMPTENVMRCLMEGGTQVLVPGGRSGKTFKAQSQSGIQPREVGWPLLINGETVETGPIEALMKEDSFETHKEAVKKLGFSLFVKRARVGQSKHIRVRPRFERWAAKGELLVTDDQITDDVLRNIFEVAGQYKGLCDWRPSSKTPGVFGMFEAEIARA